ncbi:MAG TPA: GAF domain-containing protein, partial [Acidimicrobiales bacterium]|nr:GAF domain-containing protein [Acidimicrobiales bacterium]
MTTSKPRLAALSEMCSRVAGTTGVEEVVDVALLGLEELLGHGHSLLLVHEVESHRLVTLASRGYESGGIGSEVVVGEGVIGMAAARRGSMRIGNLQRMLAYARTVQRTSAADAASSGSDIRLPGLPGARSQLAAPMISRSVLIGVMAVESAEALAFDEVDEHILTVIAHLVGSVLDREHAPTTDRDPVAATEVEGFPAPLVVRSELPVPATEGPIRLRYYAVDGSVFIDNAYIIKGVAGRLLWKVANELVSAGRTDFTNREARLDPALELPAFRDNFESRLILLKRRLEEREAPLRITGTGRGRFQI